MQTALYFNQKRFTEKADENFKYFMVFQKKDVADTYTAQSIIDIVKAL